MIEIKQADLVGGYYDAGDNVKFNFPMAFTTTMLAWSVVDFGHLMGSELKHAHEAIQWATDYFLKCTNIPRLVFVQVGDGSKDHNCWERPEDMDTPRTVFTVNTTNPGSEVSGEIAAALAASSIVFRSSNTTYSAYLLSRATKVYVLLSVLLEFATIYILLFSILRYMMPMSANHIIEMCRSFFLSKTIANWRIYFFFYPF